MATRTITVGSTTDNPQTDEVEVRDRDTSDAAMDASWARIRRSDPEGYERNGAWNGSSVVSDAEGGF